MFNSFMHGLYSTMTFLTKENPTTDQMLLEFQLLGSVWLDDRKNKRLKNMKGVKKWENIKIFNFLSWYLVMVGKVEE